MPPPNTPNDASGSNSPTTTRDAHRNNSAQTASPVQPPSSEHLFRDLRSILFAGLNAPVQTSSVSATPPVATTAPPTPPAPNVNAQRLPNDLTTRSSNMLAPTSPTVSTTPALAVGTLYHTQERANLERRRPWLHATSAPSADYVEAANIPIWSPSRSESSSESPSPVRNTQYVRSQQPFEPAIDWQCLEYVSQVDENLLCAICKAPFHRPMTTKACGHTFCQACIDQALEEARGRARNRVPCPLCRTELSAGCDRGSNRFVRVVEVSAQLDRLQVKCPNNTQLCKWTGQRSSVEDHMRNVCGYTMLPCLSDSCDKMIIRKSRGELDESVELNSLCQHYSSLCRLCKETIDMSTQDQHLLTTCREYSAPCDYCGIAIVREQLAAHGEVCAEEETTCNKARLGCVHKAKRKDIKEHEKDCKSVSIKSYVDGLLAGHIEEQIDARMKQVKADLTRELHQMMQRERRTMTEGFQELREELREALQGERKKREQLALNLSSILRYRGPPGNTADDPTSGEATDEQGRPTALLPIPEGGGSDYEQADYMFRMFDELDTRMADISKALIDQDARHSVMLLSELMPVKEQLVEARSQLGVMGMHVRWLMDLQRSRQRQIAEVVSGLTGGGGGGGSGSESSSSAATAAGSNGRSESRRTSDRDSPVRPSL